MIQQSCIRRTRCLLLMVGLLTLYGATPCQAGEEMDWSGAPARLTIREYLELYVSHRFQAYHTIRKVDVHFIPNKSPARAVLLVIKPVVVPKSDLPTRADQHKSLEHQAGIYTALARRIFEEQTVASRWPAASVEKNMIIRFVDALNPKQTIGISSAGKTVLKPDSIERAEKECIARVGSMWHCTRHTLE